MTSNLDMPATQRSDKLAASGPTLHDLRQNPAVGTGERVLLDELAEQRRRPLGT